MSFCTSKQCPIVYHLAFDDDMVIFANGSKHSLKNMMEFLNCYKKVSGQLIKYGKSCFILGGRWIMLGVVLFLNVLASSESNSQFSIWECTLFEGRKR